MRFFKTIIVLALIAILGISLSQLFAASKTTITSKGKAHSEYNVKDGIIAQWCDNTDDTVCTITVEPIQ